MQNLIYFFIAVGLSMDAFSLAIAYGTNKVQFSKIIVLSSLVGLFHYIMPYFGSIIGSNITFLITKANYIVSIIFVLLAYEMYKSRNEEHTENLTNIFSLLLFAFTVSIDSFSVGIALGLENANINIAFIIFSLVSSIFTFMGLTVGNFIAKKYGNKANYLGIIILLLIAIKYLLTNS